MIGPSLGSKPRGKEVRIVCCFYIEVWYGGGLLRGTGYLSTEAEEKQKEVWPTIPRFIYHDPWCTRSTANISQQAEDAEQWLLDHLNECGDDQAILSTRNDQTFDYATIRAIVVNERQNGGKTASHYRKHRTEQKLKSQEIAPPLDGLTEERNIVSTTHEVPGAQNPIHCTTNSYTIQSMVKLNYGTVEYRHWTSYKTIPQDRQLDCVFDDFFDSCW